MSKQLAMINHFFLFNLQTILLNLEIVPIISFFLNFTICNYFTMSKMYDSKLDSMVSCG